MRRFSRLALFTATLVGAGSFALAPAQAAAPAPDAARAEFEVDFLRTMIDHHSMAVEMAGICLDKAVHPQLRSLCRSIVASQSAQITDMQSWLQNWYGIDYEPMMSPADASMMAELAATSGPAFDRLFMQMMIEHHRTAIREATTCLRNAYHPELRRLCRDIVTSQSREVAQMTVWLRLWYGGRGSAPMGMGAMAG